MAGENPSTSSIFSQLLGAAKEGLQAYNEYKDSEGPPQQLQPSPAFATPGTAANPAPTANGMPFDPKWVFYGVVALVVIGVGVAYVSKK